MRYQNKLIFLLFLLLSLFVVSCSKDKTATIVPGERVGPVIADITEEALTDLVGSDNIRRKKIPTGEGEFANGSVLFEGTPDECEILWSGQYKKPITTVLLKEKKSSWVTAEGVTVGLSLDELMSINGKPVTFLGFDWDYGGYVMSHNGGALDKYQDKLNLRIYYTKRGESEDYTEVIGDREILSTHPVLDKMNVEIIEMRVNLFSEIRSKDIGVVHARSGLVLRSKPTVSGDKLLTIPDNTEIKVVSQDGPEEEISGITAKWIKVQYGGQIGWVFGAFVDYNDY
ncbi:MAG: SH3 domain-containing protein [Spirochaetes bacterium]|jgi:hypothetical protein|nr:SH3 domain-containing protein [Spirochaetota bacterium]